MLCSGYGGMGQACDLFSPVVCVFRINLQRQVIFTCILTQCVMWFFEPRQFHMYYHNFPCSVFFITNERHFEFLQTLHIAD